MNNRILRLTDITANVNLWGGKAVGLCKLANNGYLVPDACVVSSEVYLDYCDDKLDLFTFENDLRSFLIENKLINERLIFRSSCNLEGQKQYSSCGVFKSFIYNESNSLIEYLKMVWDSVNDPSALSYLSFVGLSITDIKMAVIIQKVQEGDFSGVIQSRDIIEDTDDIVIEMVRGSVNTVVDGCADAEIIKLQRNGIIINEHNLSPIIPSTYFHEIISTIKRLEELYETPIELEIQLKGNSLYIVQVRNLY